MSKPTDKKPTAKAFAKILKEQSLSKFSINNIIEYGTYVIENRALPDFRDGLKPVQRRLLWTMDQSSPRIKNDGPTIKSARVVGFCMAEYHPHGGDAIYGALVGIANDVTPLVNTQGGFGEFNTRPADYRYSECKLSAYSEKIALDRRYLDITPKMINYDGRNQEPLFLPTLLPHLLLNGISGIAVGVVTGIPPFHADGIIKIISLALAREIKLADCKKYLKIAYPKPFQSEILSDDEDIYSFFQSGEGNLTLGVGYNVDGNKMVIDRFPPSFKMENAIKKLISHKEVEAFIASAQDHSNDAGYKLEITLKPSVQAMGRSDIFKKCASILNENLVLRMNMINRIDEKRVKFIKTNMPDYINMWTKWRVEIEIKRHLYEAEQSAKLLANLELQVLACQNLDKIIPIIKSKLPDVDARLAKALKISLDDAKYILSLTLRRLTGLSLTELQDKIKKETALRKASLHHAKHPAEKILLDLDDLVKGIL